jgi:hypothetical protein
MISHFQRTNSASKLGSMAHSEPLSHVRGPGLLDVGDGHRDHVALFVLLLDGALMLGLFASRELLRECELPPE